MIIKSKSKIWRHLVVVPTIFTVKKRKTNGGKKYKFECQAGPGHLEPKFGSKFGQMAEPDL